MECATLPIPVQLSTAVIPEFKGNDHTQKDILLSL
jgi:hypothetical protein